MTGEQSQALADVIRRYEPTTITLRYEPFDLPAGYVEFVLSRGTEHVLTGGVAPNGDVST